MSKVNEVPDDSIVSHGCAPETRKRRYSSGPSKQRSSKVRVEIDCTGIAPMVTPPVTPHREKRVRFSEPKSSSSTTGLTPFLSRQLLSSPRLRIPLNLATDETLMLDGIYNFGKHRHGLCKRTKRRLGRRGLSEKQNEEQMEKRREKKSRQVNIEPSERDDCHEDQELPGMGDQQDIDSQIDGEAGFWPLDTSDDDFNINMTEAFTSTPGRTSLQSPPATVPNTPSRSSSHVDLTEEGQVIDDQKLHLENQLKQLQDELQLHGKTLELKNTLHERLTVKLSPFIEESAAVSAGEEHLDMALDHVLTELALTKSSALENATRFSALTHELSNLFPSSTDDPESTIKTIQSQFRAARLELEYLAPGENVEGFDNSKLLDMLLARLRMLTTKVTRQDSEIDQYHAQEVSLRQQLGSRVDTQMVLQDSVASAESEIMSLTSDIQDRDDSISKLANALQGYRDEVAGLESLVTSLEANYSKELAVLHDEMKEGTKEWENRILDLELQHDVFQATAEGREMIMVELEKRLSAALTSSASLKEDMTKLQEEKDSTISQMQQTASDREKSHGDALALRDARVAELREEIERVNASLQDAHTTIMTLKCEKRDLTAQVEGEKLCGDILIAQMQEMVQRYASRDTSVPGVLPGDQNFETGHPIVVEPPYANCVTKANRPLDSTAAKRICKKRRKYDSGLGFLDEEEEEDTVTVQME